MGSESGPVFSYKLRYIVGFWLVEMAISTNQKPTIYRDWYENTAPGIDAWMKWASTRILYLAPGLLYQLQSLHLSFTLYLRISQFQGQTPQSWQVHLGSQHQTLHVCIPSTPPHPAQSTSSLPRTFQQKITATTDIHPLCNQYLHCDFLNSECLAVFRQF